MSPCTTTTGLHCERFGSGDPVLFLHGLGASLFSWRKMIDPLETDYEVILIDLKGCGESPKPHDNRYSIHDQGDLIYQFIIEHDLRNLTLVGNSYGGGVALVLSIMLCEREPGRLSKLILIDSAGYNESLPWHLKLLRTPGLGWLSLEVSPVRMLIKTVLKYAYYNNDLIEDDQVEAYAKPLKMPGGKYALLKIGQQVIPDNIDELTRKYETICVPALIVWGEEDEVIPLRIGQKLDAAIPCSKLLTIPKCGHAPQEETPAKVIPLIRDFLQNSIPCP
jgi:pimeloyl-ACP methyl ester carboxylesterase